MDDWADGPLIFGHTLTNNRHRYARKESVDQSNNNGLNLVSVRHETLDMRPSLVPSLKTLLSNELKCLVPSAGFKSSASESRINFISI